MGAQAKELWIFCEGIKGKQEEQELSLRERKPRSKARRSSSCRLGPPQLGRRSVRSQVSSPYPVHHASRRASVRRQTRLQPAGGTTLLFC